MTTLFQGYILSFDFFLRPPGVCSRICEGDNDNAWKGAGTVDRIFLRKSVGTSWRRKMFPRQQKVRSLRGGTDRFYLCWDLLLRNDGNCVCFDFCLFASPGTSWKCCMDIDFARFPFLFEQLWILAAERKFLHAYLINTVRFTIFLSDLITLTLTHELLTVSHLVT